MYLLRYCLLIPLLESYAINPQMGHLFFLLLVVACVLTAAAGYIINDIYDVEIDNVNHPEKVIIGNTIRLRAAENTYISMIAVAITIGVFISYSIGLRSLSLLIPIVAGILYFYSTTYKGQFIIGNLMISLMTAFIPVTIILFELPILKMKYAAFVSDSDFNFNFLIAWFGYYALFAFLISLLREIIKDVEDFEGDKAYGKRTWPVAYGVKVSKIVALIILTAILFFVFYTIINYLNDKISIIYISTFIIIPCLYIGFMIVRAKEKSNYSEISKWCKMLMIFGIAYVLVFRLLILN
jgi:4-hydroxybenzoate polyprenyltransferase